MKNPFMFRVFVFSSHSHILNRWRKLCSALSSGTRTLCGPGLILAAFSGLVAARAEPVEGGLVRHAKVEISVDTEDESTPLPVPRPTQLALEYHRSGTYLWAFARVWDLAVPLALLFTGASARLRNVARRNGKTEICSISVYMIIFLVLVYLADLPLRYYLGFVRQHAYGLSRQSFGRWFGNSLKGLGLDLLGGALFAWVPFWMIRRAPRAWWIIVSALTIPFFAFLTLITPIWIEPLYNNFGPMTDPRLERKILDLAAHAGIQGSRVFEVNKSVDTKTANAYVTGLFGTKRIVLWDTLLRDFDEREVLAVMGHEMGHYVLNHVAWGLALSSTVIAVSLFWTDRAGRWLVGRYAQRLGFSSLGDVAATPLLLVLLGLASLGMGPIALAYSRKIEHQADRFALDLTHANRSAALAFADLQRENLGVPYQSFVDRLWRSTHPSVAERIEFCNAYRPWENTRKGPPAVQP